MGYEIQHQEVRNVDEQYDEDTVHVDSELTPREQWQQIAAREHAQHRQKTI